MTFSHTTHSPQETEAFARDVAKSLYAGCCVALHGQLGAGKTRFVRGIVAALGGKPNWVSSPTYVLMNLYDCPGMQVFHLDAYRVHGDDDFVGIGFTEFLEQQGVVIVEWAERITELLPLETIHVQIEAIDETSRKITVTAPD